MVKIKTYATLPSGYYISMNENGTFKAHYGDWCQEVPTKGKAARVCWDHKLDSYLNDKKENK